MAIILKKPLAEADLLDIWNFIANDKCHASQLNCIALHCECHASHL